MAEAQNELPYRFCWHIFNLSVPWTIKEATFYHGSPTQTHQWQVTFMPHDRQTNLWPYSFRLANCKYGERDDVVVPEQLWISIFVNGNEMERSVEPNYSFSRANRYAYLFLGNLSVPSEEVAFHVTIEVQLALPNQNIVDQTDEPALRFKDLRQLSSDLMTLLRSSQYSNLRLISRYPIPQGIPVHSYIIRSRWSNFFSEHPVQTFTNNAVVVNISNSKLWAILHYLYSGNFNVENPVLRDIEYMTELFQVIDRYKIHHLYKVFVVDESRQVRRSLEDLRTDVTQIRFTSLPTDGRSFTWTTDPDMHHDIHFQIRLFLNNDEPSFSYSLQTYSPGRIFVYVKLELETRHVEDRIRLYTVHVHDYTIVPGEPVTSGICNFEGNPRPISEFMDGIRGLRGGERENETEHFLRCTLYARDGTTTIMIHSQNDDRLQREVEIYKVLGEHMYELLMTPIESDFTLSCPVERPVSFRIHKGIFATRVPDWSSVLDNVPEDNVLPDEMTCSLESEAFRLLSIYIYSGRLLSIPVAYLDEIDDFIMLGGMEYLRKFMQRRRMAPNRL